MNEKNVIIIRPDGKHLPATMLSKDLKAMPIFAKQKTIKAKYSNADLLVD